MDAVEYLSTRRRLCKETHCDDCLLSIKHNGQKTSCRIFEEMHPKKAVAIVTKWAKKHPRETRMTNFLKIFPNTRVRGSGSGFIDICPFAIDKTVVCPEEKDCITCRWEYWNTEIEEDD